MSRSFSKNPQGYVKADRENLNYYVESEPSTPNIQYTDKEIREFVFSKLLKKIPDYELRTVIGRAMSDAYRDIDWQAMYRDIVYYMPEYSNGLK